MRDVRGITLIALVVTIIVLLILAGITIINFALLIIILVLQHYTQIIRKSQFLFQRNLIEKIEP